MSGNRINRQVFTDVSWWHWAITVPLLAAHLGGSRWALPFAMALCILVGGYFVLRLGQFRPMPVQVRIAYLGLLAVGTLPWMEWVHWVQLAGTAAMVTLGYCPLIRLLSLAPLNRTEPFTTALLWRVFVREPRAGGLFQGAVAAPGQAGLSCSLPAHRACLVGSLPNPQSVVKEHPHAQAH